MIDIIVSLSRYLIAGLAGIPAIHFRLSPSPAIRCPAIPGEDLVCEVRNFEIIDGNSRRFRNSKNKIPFSGACGGPQKT